MTKNSSNAKALYIHIPFCEHLCDYCDFPKLQYFTIFAKPYLKRLKEELESYKITHELNTIYIGGGTPTSLEDDLFLELFEIIKPYTLGVKEFTVECNPESLSDKKLEIMKAYGVNRLSIGVESTNDEILRSINRHHTFEDVKTAVLRAKKYGFDNLNLDLILGLPGVNKGQIRQDIANLLALEVQHISCYSLTVHPNTIFSIKHIEEPESDNARELYDIVNEELTKNGFIHYEVSNWAKEGKESKHNFVYWNNKEYYGIGLGASGYLNKVRYSNTKSITEYLKGHFLDTTEEVTVNDDIEYQIMLNLRTNQGIDLMLFKDKFQIDLYQSKQDVIDLLIQEGLLEAKDHHLIATYEGMMTLDQIILKLI